MEVQRDGLVTDRASRCLPLSTHRVQDHPSGQKGNLCGAGPGGVWIISPEGKYLGTIKVPKTVSNVAWGDNDSEMLYISASTSVYSIKLRVPGVKA
jgi:hypothetical protein